MGLLPETHNAYLERVGARYRAEFPVQSPFGTQSLNWQHCYDLNIQGRAMSLFLASYVSGGGKNSVVWRYIGIYLPPAPDVTDDWLLGWKEYVLLRSDIWAKALPMPQMSRGWGMFGAPAHLPYQALRTPDGGALLTWFDEHSGAKIGKKVEAVLESLRLAQTVPTPGESNLPWATQQTLPRHQIPCPNCATPIAKFEHPAVCSYCRSRFDSYPQPVPQLGPKLTLIRPHPIPIALASLIWLAALTPVLASFTSFRGIVPWVGLPGGLFAGIGALVAKIIMNRWGRVPLPGILMMLGTGLVLVVKPILAPVMWFWDGQTGVFTYTSETHLYFVWPGALSLILGALFLLHWFLTHRVPRG